MKLHSHVTKGKCIINGFLTDSFYACLPGNLSSFFFFYIEIFYTVCFLKAGYTCKSCPFICCTGIGLFFSKTQFEALEKSVSYIILFVRCQIVFWWLLLSFRWPVYVSQMSLHSTELDHVCSLVLCRSCKSFLFLFCICVCVCWNFLRGI